jgi:hypothetical protein
MLLSCRCSFFGFKRVTTELTSVREFSQTVTYHGFSNEDRDVLFPVVYSDGVTYEFRSDLRSSGPGFHNLLAVGAESKHLFHELDVDIWTFETTS